MKTFVRGLLFTALFSLSILRINAQCTISNILIQNVMVNGSITPGQCSVTFDFGFTLASNVGNQSIFLHTWMQQDYPNYFHCFNGHTTLQGDIHAPIASDLADSWVNIAIDNSGPDATLMTTYPADPTVPLNTVANITKTVNADGSVTFNLTGVEATMPVDCGTPEVTWSDLWSSASPDGQFVNCVSCGIQYSTNYLDASGFVNCSNLTYNATLTNNTNTYVMGYYRVYPDINGDGYFEPGIDTLIQDTTAWSVHAGIGQTTNLTGSVPPANRNQDLFLVITQACSQAYVASRVVLIPSTICAPLPVTFISFSATRIDRSNVSLRWETATEVNNSGFAIQRNTNGNWEYVTFIPTQAMGGNSTSPIVYTFTDRNNFDGVSQYRIKQVDIDGKAKYSDIRAVRGEGQSDKVIVYPNPSNTGSVTVIFENRDGLRDVQLSDNSGRTVQQWSAVAGNTIQISNLSAGMYTLRILFRETGAQTVQKIMIVQR
jgi:hypothetical protein